jgi:hypothetical protein
MKITIEIDTDELDNPTFSQLMKFLQKQSSYDVSIKQKEEKYNQSYIHKLKLFMQTFNDLSGKDREDVKTEDFFNELLNTGKFTLDDCKEFLNTALQNGQIYERRKDCYAKT